MPEMSELEAMVASDLEKILLQAEKNMQKVLTETLNSMRAEMARIYDKWAKDGVLTKAEMTAYNKYQTMEGHILELLDPAIKATVKQIKTLPVEAYDAAFFEYAWAVDQGTGVALDWGLLSDDAILKLYDIKNPKNIEWIETMKMLPDNARKFIRGALLSGLAQGKSYTQMMKDLKDGLGKYAYQVLRILRTEGQRMFSKAQYDAYEQAREQGIDGVDRWNATLDRRTRSSHGTADGTKRDKDGYFNIGGYKAKYPLDPNLPAGEAINCRCTLTMDIDGYSPEIRRTREQGLIPYMTYSDWVKEYHPDWMKE